MERFLVDFCKLLHLRWSLCNRLAIPCMPVINQMIHFDVYKWHFSLFTPAYVFHYLTQWGLFDDQSEARRYRIEIINIQDLNVRRSRAHHEINSRWITIRLSKVSEVAPTAWSRLGELLWWSAGVASKTNMTGGFELTITDPPCQNDISILQPWTTNRTAQMTGLWCHKIVSPRNRDGVHLTPRH